MLSFILSPARVILISAIVGSVWYGLNQVELAAQTIATNLNHHSQIEE